MLEEHCCISASSKKTADLNSIFVNLFGCHKEDRLSIVLFCLSELILIAWQH